MIVNPAKATTIITKTSLFMSIAITTKKFFINNFYLLNYCHSFGSFINLLNKLPLCKLYIYLTKNEKKYP